MATPKWQPGKLYPPGSLVVPRTEVHEGPVSIDNNGFETGDLTGWSTQVIGGSGAASAPSAHPHSGTRAFFWPGAPGSGSEGGTECIATSLDAQPVKAGQLITVSGWFKYNTTGDIDGSRAQARVQFYDAAMNPVQVYQGNLIKGRGNNNKYVLSSASGTAPVDGFVAAQFWVTGRGGKGHVYADDIAWNYISDEPPEGLMFKAVQPETGYSSSSEPVWPTQNGVQVVDNEVIWEAVYITRVTWQARSILVSGATEPAWPTSLGVRVADNTISWEVVTLSVEDPKCPGTKYRTIGASKVFAADDDIAPFSATVNPLDWSSKEDAGYLPTGLQAHGGNPLTALALYRSNLAAFNAEGFQLWQINENPEAMALLDALPIGTVYHHALCPVSNDLLFLSSEGVRSLSLAAGSGNLQAGDIGMPIDPMVQAALDDMPDGTYPMSLYYPAAGQYWLMFPNYPPPEPFDYYMSKTFVDGTLGNQPYLLKLDHETQSTSLLQDVTDALTANQSGYGFDISENFALAAAGGRDDSFRYRIEVFSVDSLGAFTSLGAVPLDARLSDELNAFPTDISISSDGVYIAATVLNSSGDSSDPSFMVYKNDAGSFSILTVPDPSPRFSTQVVEFSPGANYLAVSRQNPPLANEPILIYRRTGDTFAKVNGLNVRPGGINTKAGRFSPDGARFFVADHEDATPGIRVYAVSGDDFLQETIISVPSLTIGNLWKSVVAVSGDSSMVATVSGPSPYQVVLFEDGAGWESIPVPVHGLGADWRVQQVFFLGSSRLVATAYNASTSEITLVVYSISPSRVVSLEYTTLLTAPTGVHGSEPGMMGSTP